MLENRQREGRELGPDEEHQTLSGAFKLSDVDHQEVAAQVRRSAGFTGSFDVADHGALIEQLVLGLAYFSNYGELSAHTLCGGVYELNVVVVNTLREHVTASTGHIFVPRCNDNLFAAVFAAIACAATAVGSTVATDYLVVDGGHRPQINVPTDGMLVRGIIGALSCIGSMYEDAKAGALFVLAYTRALHTAQSLHGHSDEGSWVRSVLRSKHFTPSFGPILATKKNWAGLCVPQATHAGVREFIDSMTLSTAAAFAFCDTGVVVNGKTVPSVLVASTDEVDEGTVAQGQAFRLRQISQLMFQRWLGTLVTMFGISSSEQCTIDASAVMQQSFNSVDWEHDQHLNSDQLCPGYWVEPTGLISLAASQLPNGDAFGLLSGRPNVGQSVRLFPSGTVVDHCSSDFFTVEFDFCNVRSLPFVQFLQSHEQDGLGNITIHSLAIDSVAMTRVVHAANEVGLQPLERAIRARSPFSDYLWVRNNSMMLHPAEFLHLGPGIRLLFTTMVGTQPTHVFTQDDIDGMVKITNYTLAYRGVANKAVQTVKTRLYRSTCAMSLSAAVFKAHGSARRIDRLTTVCFSGVNIHKRQEVFSQNEDGVEREGRSGMTGGEDTLPGPDVVAFELGASRPRNDASRAATYRYTENTGAQRAPLVAGGASRGAPSGGPSERAAGGGHAAVAQKASPAASSVAPSAPASASADRAAGVGHAAALVDTLNRTLAGLGDIRLVGAPEGTGVATPVSQVDVGASMAPGGSDAAVAAPSLEGVSGAGAADAVARALV